MVCILYSSKGQVFIWGNIETAYPCIIMGMVLFPVMWFPPNYCINKIIGSKYRKFTLLGNL